MSPLERFGLTLQNPGLPALFESYPTSADSPAANVSSSTRGLPRACATLHVALVDKFSLLLVAVFAFLFLEERPSAGQWIGIALIGAGTLVLALAIKK